MRQGFVIINKRSGDSSTRAVSQLKRLSGMPCGHMGTLDPMADGVLPVGIGRATRLFDYFLTKQKEYIAKFRFGVDYDTLDITGELISDGGKIPTKDEILKALPTQIGDILQVPPKYSAKSVNGRRGYQLAREGKEFSLPPKLIKIYGIEFISYEEGEVTLRVVCGGGTYIRSLGRDLAAVMGTTAAMSALTRTKSGIFHIENAVYSDQLTAENVGDYIIPTENVLPYGRFSCNEYELKRLLCGLAVQTDYADGDYKIYTADGEFYGIVCVKDGEARVGVKLC